MKPIVSFDLDMTLLDHKTWTIPDSAMEALKRLGERYRIVIATGRNMDHEYSQVYRDQICPDAVIHMNGTRITVGDQTIFEHHFDKELLQRLLMFVKEQGYCVGASMDGMDYYVNPHIVEEHDRTYWNMSSRRFADAMELMEKDIKTLAYIGDEAGAKVIESHVPGIKLPMFADKKGADVVETGISKGDGLMRLCRYLGVRIEDAVAFGDSMNDYEIIQMAGTGIAMGNAIGELKEVADYVTERIDEDGILNACLKLGLIS